MVNYNMPIRILLYVAEEYKRLFKNNDRWYGLFNEYIIELPEPNFFVIYTGTENWDTDCLHLSNAYAGNIGSEDAHQDGCDCQREG